MRKLALNITAVASLTLATAGCKPGSRAPKPVRPVLTAIVEPTSPGSAVAVGTVATPVYDERLASRYSPPHRAPGQVGTGRGRPNTRHSRLTTTELALQTARADVSRKKRDW